LKLKLKLFPWRLLITFLTLVITIYAMLVKPSYSWFFTSRDANTSDIGFSALDFPEGNTTFLDLYEYSEMDETYNLLESPYVTFAPISYYVWVKDDVPYYFIRQSDLTNRKYKLTITQTYVDEIDYIAFSPALIFPEGIEVLTISYSLAGDTGITLFDFSAPVEPIDITAPVMRTVTDPDILENYGGNLSSALQFDFYIYIQVKEELASAQISAYLDQNGHLPPQGMSLANNFRAVIAVHPTQDLS